MRQQILTSRRVKDFGKAKVYDLEVRPTFLCFEDKVLRFQIPVTHVLTVAVVDRLEDLLEDLSRILL